jgi:hypothetical protein
MISNFDDLAFCALCKSLASFEREARKSLTVLRREFFTKFNNTANSLFHFEEPLIPQSQ